MLDVGGEAGRGRQAHGWVPRGRWGFGVGADGRGNSKGKSESPLPPFCKGGKSTRLDGGTRRVWRAEGVGEIWSRRNGRSIRNAWN
ncbi:hypothetical protein LC55x_0593 [Lysobacter capsici]|nr:hypothetical protein LC55x_0593 [Lysobacter capsici]